MNLYFLVEGITERKLYPNWLNILLPNFSKVQTPDQAVAYNYYLISGYGYPRMLDVDLPNSIADIKNYGTFDYLIIVLDADEISVEERKNEALAKLNAAIFDKANGNLGKCQPQIIVQQKCIESWLLGNRRVFQRQPESQQLQQYINHYNVYDHDPELMPKPSDFPDSVGRFHKAYLKLILQSRNIHYTEKSPQDAAKEYYLKELKNRVTDEPTHLQTFQHFILFCQRIITANRFKP